MVRVRVLLGEPDRATGELYRRSLEAEFSVSVAPDEGALMEALAGRSVDIVALEPMLFAGQRWERAGALCRLCAGLAIPVVICSTLDERRRGGELGVSTYLLKPVLPSRLLSALRLVVAGERS